MMKKIKQWMKYLQWLEEKRVEAMIKAGKGWS